MRQDKAIYVPQFLATIVIRNNKLVRCQPIYDRVPMWRVTLPNKAQVIAAEVSLYTSRNDRRASYKLIYGMV